MTKFNPMNEWTLRLGQRMISKIRTNGFMQVTTLGERNHGKTYYNFKNMALTLYNLYNITETEAWDGVLDYTVFTIKRFRDIVKKCRTEKYKLPFILLDDAGAHFDSGLYNRDHIQYQMLNTCLDTIKDVTNCLLVTCPFKEVLTGRLQKYDGYDVTLYMNDGYQRYGTCIKWFRLPSGTRRWRKEFEDAFSCYIPTRIHERYLDMRNEFTLSHLEQLDEIEERFKEREMRRRKKKDLKQLRPLH